MVKVPTPEEQHADGPKVCLLPLQCHASTVAGGQEVLLVQSHHKAKFRGSLISDYEARC
jgi:hypothetical protein